MSEAHSLGLDPDEKVLWTGRPDPWRYAWYRGKTRAAFGLFQLLLAIYLGNLVLEMWRSPIRTDALWWSNAMMLLAVAFLIVVALGALLAPLWLFFEARRARYALTNRRAIIAVGAPFARVQSFPLTALPFIEIQPAAASSGHVLFASAQPSHWSRGPAKDGFLAISEPSQVERLLRERLA